MKYLVIIFVFLSTIPCLAQSEDRLSLESNLEMLRENLSIPGIAVAVSKNGNPIRHFETGFRDLKNQKKVDGQTQFRMASVSKLFAAGAIAKLLNEGSISLDDEVERYLVEYPHAGKGVTIRRILNHTSGIRHYNMSDWMINNKNYDSTTAALEIFLEDELLHAPGQAYKYSTHAYTILAAIVEKVSGMSYVDYLSSQFFKPLGMDRSGPDIKKNQDSNVSQLYKGSKETKFDNPSYKRAGGGMLSTPTDLVQFGSQFLETRYFNSSTLDSIFKPTSEIPGSLIPTSVGMGWRISDDRQEQIIYHHAGSMNGARSFLMVSPEDSMVVSVMSNNRSLDFIEHLACGIRDYYDQSLKDEDIINWKYSDGVKLTGSGEGIIANVAIELPGHFDEPKALLLVKNKTKTGFTFRNLSVEKGILYIDVSEEALEIYVKDENDSWVKKIFQKE